MFFFSPLSFSLFCRLIFIALLRCLPSTKAGGRGWQSGLAPPEVAVQAPGAAPCLSFEFCLVISHRLRLPQVSLEGKEQNRSSLRVPDSCWSPGLSLPHPTAGQLRACSPGWRGRKAPAVPKPNRGESPAPTGLLLDAAVPGQGGKTSMYFLPAPWRSHRHFSPARCSAAALLALQPPNPQSERGRRRCSATVGQHQSPWAPGLPGG